MLKPFFPKGNWDDAAAVRRAKKRILAEFELADASTIMVGGVELDKSSLLSLLEELKDEGKRAFHAFMMRSPGLLLFLQTGEVDRALLDEGVLEDAALRRELEKVFVEPFGRVLNRAYRKGEVAVAKLLLEEELPEAWEHDAYRRLLGHLTFTANELKACERRLAAGVGSADEVFELLGGLEEELINALPSYFEAQKAALIDALIGIAYKSVKEDKKLTAAIVDLLEELELSENQRLRMIFLRVSASRPFGSGEGFGTSYGQPAKQEEDRSWMIAVVVFKVILLLAVILGKDGGRSSSTYRYDIPKLPTVPYYMRDSSFLKQSQDQTLRRLEILQKMMEEYKMDSNVAKRYEAMIRMQREMLDSIKLARGDTLEEKEPPKLEDMPSIEPVEIDAGDFD